MGPKAACDEDDVARSSQGRPTDVGNVGDACQSDTVPIDGDQNGADAGVNSYPGASGALSAAQEQVVLQWNALTREQRNQVLAVIGLIFAIMVMDSRMVVTLLAALLAMYLHTQLPNTQSFETFFRHWYIDDYFPQVSSKIQQELKQRAKNQSWLDGMATSFKGWVIGQTSGLQATAMYELAVKHSLPAHFGDLFFMRTATVNVGSAKQPCLITFWGAHQRWMLAPTCQIDVQNVSLLDEMDRQRAATTGTS